jgi:uncharacterized membrane-anchored protein
MHDRHLPALGPRFWAALCLASVFGANMGDFFAHNLGLGHVAGLPFLALAFAVILIVERFDRAAHEAYYWLAIIVIRTAATNLADFFCGDLRQPRPWIMAALGFALAIVVTLVWNAWRRSDSAREAKALVLRADAAYWLSMLLAGTLGTVLGDYASHDLHLGNARASLALGLVLAGFFAVGSRGLIWSATFYWATVVMVRAAGTTVGDFTAQRDMLGLAFSTAASGLAFVVLLVVWNGRRVRSVS